MKPIPNKITNKTYYRPILSIFVLLIFASCARKISFQPSAFVPAAEGRVKIQKDRNNNYNIKVDIFNLAEPERLQPPAKIYLLWMEVDHSRTLNLGQIKTSKKAFSKSLKASFKTSSPYKPDMIMVTAEEDANVQAPGFKVILTTNRF